MQYYLDHPQNAGSLISGNVGTYEANWNSSKGWVDAFAWTATGLWLGSEGNPVAGGLALGIAAKEMGQAATIAVDEAKNIVAGLTNQQTGYLGAPRLSRQGDDGQIIDLVGHSRGAAVNALVADLLTSQGYHIDQYDVQEPTAKARLRRGGRRRPLSVT